VTQTISDEKKNLGTLFQQTIDKLSPQEEKEEKSKKTNRDSENSAPTKGVKNGAVVSLHSENFDIVLNILIGIRKSLSNLVDLPHGGNLTPW